MPTPRRRAWAAQNPVPIVTGAVDRQWDAATQAWHSGVDRATDLAGYTVQNPIDAARDMGDFSADAARAVWDVAQDKWGLGQQWWNAVVDVWESPCEGKWSVYLETMLPAAGNALWLLLVPSPDEILENYLQPYKTKAGRRGSRRSDPDRRRTSKSGRRRRSWPIVPDIDAAVAANLPGRAAVAGRDAGRGQRWIFEGIDIADRVAWYWLVAEVTETFVVGWTTGLRESKFCSDPQTAYLNVGGGNLPGNFEQIQDLYDERQVNAITNGEWSTGTFEPDSDRIAGRALLTLDCENQADDITQQIHWGITAHHGDEVTHEHKVLRMEPGQSGQVHMTIAWKTATQITLESVIEEGNHGFIHYTHFGFVIMAPESKQPPSEEA